MVGRKWWQPWVWLSPALLLAGVYLVYPMAETVRQSLYGPRSREFVGLENYEAIVANPTPFLVDTHSALMNNLLWIVAFTAVTVSLGLVFAVLAGRVRYEAAAKSAVFIPMAISFVAASVIWKFMYDVDPDVGTVNAVMTVVGGDPVGWLVNTGAPYAPFVDAGPRQLPGPLQLNNFALIFVGIWMWTGFATVVLSAGLKNIPNEIIEAARVDGANENQVFWRITLPVLAPTVAVVATTLIIQSLKLFDLIWVMTGGRYDTHVIASLFFEQAFRRQNFGLGAALAVVLFLGVLPIMAINIRQFEGETT